MAEVKYDLTVEAQYEFRFQGDGRQFPVTGSYQYAIPCIALADAILVIHEITKVGHSVILMVQSSDYCG